MMLFVSRFLLLLTGVLFLAGCMSFDYVGQSFVPLSDSVPVNIFQNREVGISDTEIRFSPEVTVWV